jgi:hypothetical protein
MEEKAVFKMEYGDYTPKEGESKDEFFERVEKEEKEAAKKATIARFTDNVWREAQ